MNEKVRTRQAEEVRHDTHADINQASKIGLGLVVALAGLVGMWSIACMISAVSTAGIGGVISGFVRAVSGM